jgi:hypothetical protein
MSQDEFGKYVAEMRDYRDKFIAHLDHDNTMQIPMLDPAHASVSFYHAYLVTHEVQAGELAGIGVDTPDKFRLGYKQCVEEATETLRRALADPP